MLYFETLIQGEVVIKDEAPLVDGMHGRNIIQSQVVVCSIAGNHHGTAQDVLPHATPAQPAGFLTHANTVY